MDTILLSFSMYVSFSLSMISYLLDLKIVTQRNHSTSLTELCLITV